MEKELNEMIETLDFEIKYLENRPMKRSTSETIEVLRLRRKEYKVKLRKMKVKAFFT
jgi:hypothetical protein